MTTRDDDAKASFALTKQLAALMPEWTAAPPNTDYYWASLERADGATLLVRVGGWHNEGRVTFSPQWPKFADGRVTTPPRFWPTKLDTRDWRIATADAHNWDITVSQKRSPEAMVREIRRRLLPGYDTMFAIALEGVRATDRNCDESQVVAKRLASIVGGRVVEQSYRTGESVHVSTPYVGIHRMKVQPQYEGIRSTNECSVSFEVHHLDPETTAEVLAIIAARATRAEASTFRVVATPIRVDIDAEVSDELPADERRHLRMVR